MRTQRPRVHRAARGAAILATSASAIAFGARPARAEIAPPPSAEEAAPAPAPSDAEKARGLAVAKVTIAGNRRVAGDDLAAQLAHLRPGAAFTPEGLAADVRALYATGLLDDVEVDMTVEGGTVRLRVLVRERPTVEAVLYEGNDTIAKDDLDEALSSTLKPGDVLDGGAVRRAAQKLRDKYAEEGYFLAEVTPEVLPRRREQATVRFHVREHEKVSVRRINFVGNTAVPSSDLEEAMMTGKGGLLAFLGVGPGGPFRQDVFERDLLVLNALYYDRGFLTVQVDTPRVMLTPDRQGVEITVTISEGPRFRIRRLRIAERDEARNEVEPLGGRRHLREMLHAKTGDWFDRATLVKDLAAVQTLYRDEGYANVEAVPATDLDADRAEVDVDVSIRRGPVVRFGRIEIRGNTKTRDKVIRREMEIAEEGLFSETKLARSRARIQALGYFEHVEITTSQGDDAGHLNVDVDVGEKPTGTFQVGAGFSSLESFMLTAQIQQQNLFGRGQALSVQAQISGLRQLVDLRFVEPRLFDSKLSLAASLSDQVRVYDQFSQESKGGSLTVGYPLIEPKLRASLTYTLQQDQLVTQGAPAVLGTSSAASVFQRLPLANLFAGGVTSSLRPAITYDARDNQLFPTSGLYLSGSVEVASSLLGSQNTFVRWQGSAKAYYPLTNDHSLVLRYNGEAGLVTSPSPHGVPVFSRYFLGGITDVRGFPLRSLGPRLPLRTGLDDNSPLVQNGATIGGNLMFYQNVELEFPILQAINLRGVVFTDLGNTWNLERQYCRAAPGAPAAALDPCFSASRLLDQRASVGFGVRWLSPMGPLRFEWGFPIHRMPYEQPVLFEFTIGNAF